MLGFDDFDDFESFFCGSRADSWQLFESSQMYRKSSIKPLPFGLFISNKFRGGGVNREGARNSEGGLI